MYYVGISSSHNICQVSVKCVLIQIVQFQLLFTLDAKTQFHYKLLTAHNQQRIEQVPLRHIGNCASV